MILKRWQLVVCGESSGRRTAVTHMRFLTKKTADAWAAHLNNDQRNLAIRWDVERR